MKRIVFFVLSVVCLSNLCFHTALGAAGKPEVSYVVSMPEPHTHYFEVQMEVKNIASGSLEIKLPVWAPGSYLVREFAKNIQGFSAESTKGNPVTFAKTDKNTWKVQKEKADNVVIRYKVYANELTVRTSYLDADHGYINGTSVFMFVEGTQSQKLRLKVEPYKDWQKVSTTLKRTSTTAFEYEAVNYDELVDCPLEIGNHAVYSFEADGIPHEIALFGDGNFSPEMLVKDIKKIVETTSAIFTENPVDRYLFIIHNLGNGRGGLEHMNSTTIQINRWAYNSESNYNYLLSVVAHEYFHLWLVKRLRPKELLHYQYNHEMYTDLLWIMEGFTSYYDELILYRAGIYSREKYLSILASTINKIENRPGKDVQSLSESSFDTWIKFYRSNENTQNSEVSYYTRGSVMAMLMDVMIIKQTNGTKKLEDVVQYMYDKYYKEYNVGIDTELFIKSVKAVTGADISSFVKNHILSTEPVDYNQILGEIGIIASLPKSQVSGVQLGIEMERRGENIFVKYPILGSPAYNAGINAFDEIISIDNYRVSTGTLEKILSQYSIGDVVKVVVNRDGIVRAIDVELTPFNTVHYQLNEVSGMPDEAIKLKEFWLKR